MPFLTTSLLRTLFFPSTFRLPKILILPIVWDITSLIIYGKDKIANKILAYNWRDDRRISFVNIEAQENWSPLLFVEQCNGCDEIQVLSFKHVFSLTNAFILYLEFQFTTYNTAYPTDVTRNRWKYNFAHELWTVAKKWEKVETITNFSFDITSNLQLQRNVFVFSY